jgi:hypothetical protein
MRNRIMKLHQWPLLLLIALCGCDQFGKGFARPVPVAKKMVAPLPPPRVSPPPPPIEEPPVETIKGAPVAAETSPKDAAPTEETAQPEPMPTTASLILYEDSFADVAGSIRRKVDGKQQPAEGPPASRTVYTFQAMREGGTLTLRIFEDNTTAGPDGKPGVLAMGWEEIPKKLPWSGFVYLGGATAPKRMTVSKLKTGRTIDDLRALRLKFSYRGVTVPNGTPVQIPVNCRLEPVLEDSYNRRIDFGILVAGDEWKTLDVSLADGKNLEAFLKTIAEDNPPGFKIVFGQSGPIEKYHAGDTLQIDDISVMSVPAR